MILKKYSVVSIKGPSFISRDIKQEDLLVECETRICPLGHVKFPPSPCCDVNS